MDGMRAPNGVGACFGQAEVAHLTGTNQLSHRADCFLNWSFGIDAMLIIKIDAINAEPAKTRVTGLLDVVRFAIDPAKSRRPRVAYNPEFGCDHHAVAFTANAPPEQLLVRVGSVDVGSIEEINPEVDRAIDRGKRLCIVTLAIKF